MRNPVGPLPSSIYWRRRAVAATPVALLALLGVWIVTSGGSGRHSSSGPRGAGPATSITPGPSGSGPAISQVPGGRSTSSGSGGTGDSDGSGDAGPAGDGTGGFAGTDTGGASAAGNEAGGSAGSEAGATGAGAGQRVPVGSTLPDCTAASVRLTLYNPKNSYPPGENPKFELIAKNTSATGCKLDFGPMGTLVTITSTEADKPVWASKDCPKDGAPQLFQVPANTSVIHTVEWDRRTSSPQCGAATAAGAGTYLVEVKVPGLPLKQTSIVLAKD